MGKIPNMMAPKIFDIKNLLLKDFWFDKYLLKYRNLTDSNCSTCSSTKISLVVNFEREKRLSSLSLIMVKTLFLFYFIRFHDTYRELENNNLFRDIQYD